MKKLLIITLGIFIFGIVSFKVFSAKIVKDASALENTFIEVKNIPDGSYKGHSELGPVIVDVNVIIKDGKIENIELLKHQNGFGNAANSIVKNMVQKNTYNVDAISGATVSSKVIINAVNNALEVGLF